MNLNWVYKPFSELSSIELYAILQLRSEVFVVEQNCVYQDIDGKDLKSYHLMGFDENNLVAYSRLLPQGLSFTEASIGRVITSPAHRAKGHGISLLENSIPRCCETFQAKQIRIGAQVYLRKFYESFGFIAQGEEFLEDGIPHIEMLWSK
jgi:ElaA protein